MTSPFVYLTVCSIRNGALLRLRRLRQPRYLVIAVGAVVYVGSLMVGRPASGTLAMLVGDGARVRLIAAAVATLMLGLTWVLPGPAPLRFTSAEVQFLLTAPIPRRQVIAYKVYRLLLASAGMGAFLTILIGPLRLVPGAMFAAKSAIISAIVTLHGAGVAMYLGRAKEQGYPPGRWRVAVAACFLTPVLGGGLVWLAFSSGLELLAALPLAALAILANALWIVRSDHAFEEAVTEAKERVEPRPVRARSTPFRLAPRGPIETAILWKNWMLLGRMSRRALITWAIIVPCAIGGFAVAAASDELFASDVVGTVCLMLAGLVVFMGPAMIRIDLRQDLGHLALIKMWPVRGSAIVRGEILAPAIALSLFAAVCIVVGSLFSPELLLVDHVDAAARAAFAMSGLLVVTAVIVAQLVVHNGIAAAFPAWVSLKSAAAGPSMEMNVRMMIVMYGVIVLLGFLLVIPSAAAAAAYFAAGGLLIPSAIFAALLHGESFAATEIIGRILDRTDLQDAIVTE